MRSFLINLLLAIAWVMLTADPTMENFIGGFVIGFLMLWLVESSTNRVGYSTRAFKAITFIFYFIKEVLIANYRLVVFLFSRNDKMRPGIVRIPIDLKSDAAITLLANVITLTPGTLTLDVAEDKSALYVHAIYMQSPEALVAETKEGFERRIKEIFE